MKPTVQQISNLLALKRAEHPDAEYWQEFICEFHQNRREQSVKKSGLANVFGLMSSWFSDLGPSKWAYGVGVAYAAVTVVFLLTPRAVVTEGAPASPAKFERVPTPQVEQLKQLDLSPLTQGNAGEQVF
ncbi:MAG: hypothetical protein V4819_13680 [Verrucomicrobiota bacterium]